METEKFQKVLDKGYVRLVDSLGDDRTVANAARVSFNKETHFLDDKDKKLIQFLAREGHTSPFRHVSLQFEIYAPLMIARQWYKYHIGSNNSEFSAWNESSRRYVTEDEEFYIPSAEEWRSYPENVKQGSGQPLSKEDGDIVFKALNKHVDLGVQLYKEAMEMGVTPEQARLFLPANGLYVRWYWTASLQSVAHMIMERTAPDAQYEFQLYAEIVESLAKSVAPYSLEALTGKKNYRK